jgi:2-methylisocitrate lyase-like PEP mutase family enzyme
MESPGGKLRELMREDGILVQPNVFDALTARVAESIGFDSIGLGGFQIAAHLMGDSEPLLSLEDVATAVRYASAAVSIPIMVDAGAGWGEPLHVMRTVRVLEGAGAAGIKIEDQIFPKRAHYHKGIEHVIPVEEMIAKIRAAVRARRDPDLVLVARTDAFRTDGYDEAIRRCFAYVEAGADVAYIFPNNEDEARRAPQDLKGIPLVFCNSEGDRRDRPIFSAPELQELGYKFAAFPLVTTNAAVAAVRDVVVQLRDNGFVKVDQEERIATRKFIEDTIGLEEAYALEEATVENR